MTLVNKALPHESGSSRHLDPKALIRVQNVLPQQTRHIPSSINPIRKGGRKEEDFLGGKEGGLSPDDHVLFIRCQEPMLRGFSGSKRVITTVKVENRLGKMLTKVTPRLPPLKGAQCSSP